MAAPLFLSSGDLIADRRYDFARDFQLRGDIAAAADLMAQAVELAPRFASAWFALGELREKLGECNGAIDAYRYACAAEPEDRHGAKLRLMRLGALELSEMPPDYVRTLFDQYAPRFDKALIGELNYRGPEILLKAVLSIFHGTGRPASFKRAADLGCGTGLAAREFVANVDEFIGVDLSPGMIEEARTTGLYTRLDVADMVQGLRAEPNASVDLVLAADAVNYLRDLAPLMTEAARVLRPGGIFAFTTETHGGSGVILGAGLRYCHAPDYLRDQIAAAGLELCSLSAASTRTEHHEPVPGLVVVARR
ncbi:methyltransferase [Afipia sp. Root123D2]|uniref:class I SAM-dependent DNA methyltransferase n=1 Tax=Afipia sp. Root123D2 TaxID=1736436 RepID=UPI0006FA8715|nr:methyltransferase domain-containing protein [Afipia sp. Root123D2]KQW21286.1 methyltransferase [Afipia sp. Root123D2]